MVGMIMQNSRNKDERSLQNIGGQKPKSSHATYPVAQLAADKSVRYECSEAEAHMLQLDDSAAKVESADSEECGVSGLLGGEYVIVWEGDYVHDSGCKGKHHEFRLEEEVARHIAHEMSFELVESFLHMAS